MFPANPSPGQEVTIAGRVFRFDGVKWLPRFVPFVAPVGTMIDYAWWPDWRTDRWLFCDGSWYYRDTYPALFNHIGAMYGGDGATYFHVPDCRARATVGVDPEYTGRITTDIGINPTVMGHGGGSQGTQNHGHIQYGHQHHVDWHQHHNSGHGGHRQGFPAWVPGSNDSGFYPRYGVYNQGPDFGIADTWGAAAGWTDAGYGGVGTTANGEGWLSAVGSGGSQNMPPCMVFSKLIYAGPP